MKISNRKSFDNQELKKNFKNVHVNQSANQITHVTHEYKKGYQGRTNGGKLQFQKGTPKTHTSAPGLW